MNFRIFFIWYNVDIYMILTQKIIWEPINCDIFLEKVYVRLNENGHNVSINLRPEKQATLRRTWLPLASAGYSETI